MRFLLITPLLLATILVASCAQQSASLMARPQTTNKTALRIHQQLPRYAKLKRQPWPHIQPDTLPLKPDMKNSAVPLIRQRLILLGDLKATDSTTTTSELYDHKLAMAISHFQWRHGIKVDGEIGQRTLRLLNISPAKRLRQLQHSMQRWAKFPEDIGSRYIRINIPSFRLNLIKDGKKVIDMKVIAGRPSRPTPELYSKIETLVLNPKWNIPPSIARRDIIPKILQDPDYLAKENIEIYTSWRRDANRVAPQDVNWLKVHRSGFRHRFTQAPGQNNALGQVKFVFLNSKDVYLHDTPQKGLFAKIQRAYSSGCIRLEEPFHLVEYFIKENESLEHQEVEEHLLSGKTKYLKIAKPIPIYITYITAWVDKKGNTHFREDIYKREHSL